MSPDELEDRPQTDSAPLTDADEASGAGYGNNAEEETGAAPDEEERP